MAEYRLDNGTLVAVGVSPAPEAVPGGWLLHDAGPLVHAPGPAEWFYRHGWNSWSPTGWVPLAGDPLVVRDDEERRRTADDAHYPDIRRHSGSAIGALRSADGTTLLLGSVECSSPRVNHAGTALSGTLESSAGTWFVAVGDESTTFTGYARMLRERLGASSRRADRIWSTWYSQYEQIDEDVVAGLLQDLEGYPFDVVQVDDGWQRSVGDWEANDAFRTGMTALAARINAAGFRAGLWLAPLIATPSSAFATDHADLLVRGADGDPAVAGHNWGEPYFALDTTNPRTIDHLRRTFERVAGWGFDFLKLDFLAAGATTGARFRDVPREQAYREAIALIRSCVGDEVYLLGSGAPVIPSIGILDGIRVGPDTAAYWMNTAIPHDPTAASTRNALATSAARAWLSDVIQLDPDVVYFRRRRSLLDDEQRAAAQQLAGSYGFRSTSDPIAWLDDSEREELRAWLQSPSPGTWLNGRRFQLADRILDIDALLSAPFPMWSAAE